MGLGVSQQEATVLQRTDPVESRVEALEKGMGEICSKQGQIPTKFVKNPYQNNLTFAFVEIKYPGQIIKNKNPHGRRAGCDIREEQKDSGVGIHGIQQREKIRGLENGNMRLIFRWRRRSSFDSYSSFHFKTKCMGFTNNEPVIFPSSENLNCPNLLEGINNVQKVVSDCANWSLLIGLTFVLNYRGSDVALCDWHVLKEHMHP
ncbi:hypothetical protein V8G54_021883 [Vigna mungo]|uniref:Uncharacterized protein n=1 Tax=Vigna mungo TaxID=3915 RepID=A0AAQ3RW76_VIGMU